jgi:hypothetical protein
MFAQLHEETAARALDPLPGWFDRRRQDLPAAEEVLAKLPTGPAMPKATDAAPGAPSTGSGQGRRRA